MIIRISGAVLVAGSFYMLTRDLNKWQSALAFGGFISGWLLLF